MSSTYKPFTPDDAAVVLVDHQPGVVAMMHSVPVETMTFNTAFLARLGEELDIPLLITSTREDEGVLGTTLPEIQQAAPRAYRNRIRRAGTMDAFLDPAFVAALKALGRKNLVMAGLTTDVCLWHSAFSANEAGYTVHAVADASGSSSALVDMVYYDRMRALGIGVGSAMGTLLELYPNLSTPEGKRAEAVVHTQAQAMAAVLA